MVALAKPNGDAFRHGVNLHDCLCSLGLDREDASEQMRFLWLNRILHAGLDRAQTGDGDLASVSDWLRGRRSEAG